MTPLRIGVNALYLLPGAVGGTEIYLRNLLAALAAIDPHNHYYVFLNRETAADLLPSAPNFHAVPHPVPARIRPLRILWEQLALPAEAVRLRLDVLLNPGFTAPLLAPIPNLTVIHDLQFRRHPEHFSRADLLAWRLLVAASIHRSRLLITPSAAARADLLSCYRLPPARVTAVPLGVEPRFFSLGLSRAAVEPYLLCVSTLHPHKNLSRLLRVFARFRATHPEFRLVLCGLRGFHTQAVEALVAELNLQAHIRLTGWIPREEVYHLYARARAFVYPSTFEGFGIPVVEALAAALPTACSDIEPLATLAGSAALRFPPEDEAAMLQALERLVAGPTVNAAGPAQAAAYRWEATARATLDLLYRSTSSS
jgi:glycosyltransferase involved in cell wall biosynthesis